MSLLGGKVAVVTGGATGLGRAICLRYAGQGARVVVADRLVDEGRETVELVRAAGGEAIFARTDVTSADDMVDAVGAAESAYGALHVMTANAGILGRSHHLSIVDVADDDCELVMRVNFMGVWLALKHSIPAIRRAGGGAITVTASTAAHQGMGTLPAYSASKAAVAGLVRSVAADVGPRLRVNSVSAGPMATALPKHTAELMGLHPNVTPSSPAASAAVDPDLMARVHLFLASDLAEHVNGQMIVVDAGQSNIPA